MKFGPKYYWKPTSVKIRKFADALLAASTLLLGYEVLIASNPKLGFIIMGVSVIAKFLSNFFSENTSEN